MKWKSLHFFYYFLQFLAKLSSFHHLTHFFVNISILEMKWPEINWDFMAWLLIYFICGIICWFFLFLFFRSFVFNFIILFHPDFLSLSGDDDTPQKRERENDCLCTGQIAKDHSCICCLDFNVSETFDLGPACVRVRLFVAYYT